VSRLEIMSRCLGTMTRRLAAGGRYDLEQELSSWLASWLRLPAVDASPEPGRVIRMFDEIARTYDRLNDVMTAGLHHRWRELGVLVAQVKPGDTVLDVCCGTGDFAFALRRAVGKEGRVVAVDLSAEMLTVAKEKCGRNQLHVDFELADALALPFPDRSFAACTVGFGVRNLPDIVRGFREMRRVCREGSKVVCLEITQPQIPVFREFYGLWFRGVVPRLGSLLAGDRTAYSYLPASVARFPDPERLKSLMEQAGLRNVRYEILAGGIIALHHGVA